MDWIKPTFGKNEPLCSGVQLDWSTWSEHYWALSRQSVHYHWNCNPSLHSCLQLAMPIFKRRCFYPNQSVARGSWFLIRIEKTSITSVSYVILWYLFSLTCLFFFICRTKWAFTGFFPTICTTFTFVSLPVESAHIFPFSYLHLLVKFKLFEFQKATLSDESRVVHFYSVDFNAFTILFWYSRFFCLGTLLSAAFYMSELITINGR